MTDWVDQIDSSKMSVLLPALIGVLVAYAKWKGQDDAVKYGGVVMIAAAPFVAVLAVPIENFPTFVLVLFCIVVAGAVGVRHIPWRSKSDWGRNLLCAGFLFSVVLWLMFKTLGPDQTPRYAVWLFLGLFGGTTLISLILLVLDNLRGTLVLVVSYSLGAAVLMGLWWIITLLGLHESRPAIAEAIVYVALVAMGVVPVAYLMMRGKVSVESR